MKNMAKLMSDVQKGDKVYMAEIYKCPADRQYHPRITELYVTDIEMCSDIFDAGYAIISMTPTRYSDYQKPTYRTKVLRYEMDELDILPTDSCEYKDGKENYSSEWSRTFFASRQNAINYIVFELESSIVKYLDTLRNFKKSYGNSDYDFFRMRTKEYSEDYHRCVKYEIIDGLDGFPKTIEQTLEKSKYMVYSRKVELDRWGQVRTWGAPWLYQGMDPVLVCDTLEEASTWVAENDKSKDEYLTEVTQYSIKEVKPLITKKK